jgi:hypothetical protein
MMDKLRHISAIDLQCALAQRTFADNNGDIPLSLVSLACAIACVLGIEQRFLLAELLRDAADELEKGGP